MQYMISYIIMVRKNERQIKPYRITIGQVLDWPGVLGKPPTFTSTFTGGEFRDDATFNLISETPLQSRQLDLSSLALIDLIHRYNQGSRQMTTIGIFEAKNRLSELVARAAGGEEIVITRRGEQVARLVAPEVPNAQGQVRALADRIRRSRAGQALGGAASIRAMIDEGRR